MCRQTVPWLTFSEKYTELSWQLCVPLYPKWQQAIRALLECRESCSVKSLTKGQMPGVCLYAIQNVRIIVFLHWQCFHDVFFGYRAGSPMCRYCYKPSSNRVTTRTLIVSLRLSLTTIPVDQSRRQVSTSHELLIVKNVTIKELSGNGMLSVTSHVR